MSRKNIEPVKAEVKVALNFAGIQHGNMKKIMLLSFLFAADAFGGAFIAQTYLSFYYEEKYDKDFKDIGNMLFFCNIISGISGVLSSKLVNWIGALATMIYTHLPSNFFLIAIAFLN